MRNKKLNIVDDTFKKVNKNKGMISHIGLIAFSLIAINATALVGIVAWGTLAYGIYAAYKEWGDT